MTGEKATPGLARALAVPVGRVARAMVAMYAVGGLLFERVFATQVERDHFLGWRERLRRG